MSALAVSNETRAASAPERSGPKRRDREVIETAARIFYERGYAGTSVGEIASALGILKGSLYYYIASKEHLLDTIVSQVQADVRCLLAMSVARTDLGPLDQLALFIHRQVEYNARNVVRIAVYNNDMSHLNTVRMREIVDEREAMTQQVTALIHEAQLRNEIDPGVDATLASYCVFATINWICRWYRPGGRIGPRALADHLRDYALYGLVGAAAASGGRIAGGSPGKRRRAAETGGGAR
jgi:AcrR family transcriptional regulator